MRSILGRRHLWHVTAAKNEASIKKHGLDPSKAGRHVYLALDEAHASGYDAFFPGESVILLKIDVRGLDEGLLGPDDTDLPDILAQDDDERDYRDVSWRESLRMCGQATYDGVIAPRFIHIEERWKSAKFDGARATGKFSIAAALFVAGLVLQKLR